MSIFFEIICMLLTIIFIGVVWDEHYSFKDEKDEFKKWIRGVLKSKLFLFLFIFAIVSIFVFFFMKNREDKWLPIYFLNENNSAEFLSAPNEYDSLDECREWIETFYFYNEYFELEQQNYECGLNCAFDFWHTSFSCEEIIK